jgi:hypothetical protein
MLPSVVLAGEGDAPVWSKDNDHPHPLTLLGDLFPSPTVNVAIDDGFRDREGVNLLHKLGLSSKTDAIA